MSAAAANRYLNGNWNQPKPELPIIWRELGHRITITKRWVKQVNDPATKQFSHWVEAGSTDSLRWTKCKQERMEIPLEDHAAFRHAQRKGRVRPSRAQRRKLRSAAAYVRRLQNGHAEYLQKLAKRHAR